VEDIFKYLERVFELVVEENYKPVLILDEMQTIKEIVNTAGKPVISGLFNFLIGITKEKHLCHCLCATSDCLFIDMVYNNARLEGRAEYILVDDLDKDSAIRVYEEFGLEDKKLVWDYIGGKIGDMIKLFERKKRGYSEKDALEMMLLSEVDKLDELLRRIKRVKKKVVFEGEEIEIEESGLRESLSVFKFEEEVRKDVIDIVYRNFLIEQNILFYNPLTGRVRPQSRLLWRAIKEVMSNE
jgi:AAA+ ATPase superfamily predicted ATPase